MNPTGLPPRVRSTSLRASAARFFDCANDRYLVEEDNGFSASEPTERPPAALDDEFVATQAATFVFREAVPTKDRSGSNWLFFMWTMLQMRHWKIPCLVIWEAIDAKKQDDGDTLGVHQDTRAKVQEAIDALEASGENQADPFYNDMIIHNTKHALKEDEHCIGFRVHVFVNWQVNMSLVMNQWFLETAGPQFQRYYSQASICDELWNMNNKETVLRHLCVAMGDRKQGDGAGKIIDVLDELAECSSPDELSWSVFVMFACAPQIENTEKILMDGMSEQECARCKLSGTSKAEMLKPETYGTLLKNFDGTYCVRDDPYDTDAQANNWERTDMDDEEEQQEFVPKKKGGVTDGEQKKRKDNRSILGMPRMLPPTLMFSQDRELRQTRGTVLDGPCGGSRWEEPKYVSWPCIVHGELALATPAVIKTLARLCKNDDELRKIAIPLYDEATPVCQEVTASRRVEHKTRFERRQAVAELYETVQTTGTKPLKTNNRVASDDQMPYKSDKDETEEWIAARINFFIAWLDSDASSFRLHEGMQQQEFMERCMERSALIENVKDTMLTILFDALFNKAGHHNQFWACILDFCTEHLTPAEWAKRRMFYQSEQTSSDASGDQDCTVGGVDAWERSFVPYLMDQVLGNVDVKYQFYEQHYLWLWQRIIAMNCSVPAKGGQKPCGNNWLLIPGMPGVGKTYVTHHLQAGMVPGTFEQNSRATDVSQLTVGSDKRGNPRCYFQNMCEFYDEGSANQLNPTNENPMPGNGKRGQRMATLDPKQVDRLSYLKMRMGEEASSSATRAIVDQTTGKVRRDKQYYHNPGGGIISSNEQRRAAQAILDRLCVYHIVTPESNKKRVMRRAELTPDEVFGRTANESLPKSLATVNDVKLWQLAHAVTAIVNSIEAAGLIDMTQQETTSRNIIEEATQRMGEKLRGRVRGKCLGLARGMTTFLRVLMALFTQAGLDSICQGLNCAPVPDVNQRHAVPRFIAQIMAAATAPFPDPAIYALGTLTNREFCKCSEALVVLYLGGMAKLNHFSIKHLIDTHETSAQQEMHTSGCRSAEPVLRDIAALQLEGFDDAIADAEDELDRLGKAVRHFAERAADTLHDQDLLLTAQEIVKTYTDVNSLQYKKHLQACKRKRAVEDLNRVAGSAMYVPSATWTANSAPGEDLNFDYLNCGQGMEEVINTLGTKGMTKQLTEMTLTELSQRVYSGRERAGKSTVNAMQFTATTEAQWDASTDAPTVALPIVQVTYDVKNRKTVVCVAAGYVFKLLEELDLHPEVVRLLGDPFNQELPENFSQMSMDVSMHDRMRKAVAHSLPGGLPRGVFYFDGTIPTTQSHGAFPAFAGTMCPTSVYDTDMTTTESPRNVKEMLSSQESNVKRQKTNTQASYHRATNWKPYDSYYGAPRKKFLGLEGVDKRRGGAAELFEDTSVDFLQQRIEQEGHHGSGRQALQRLHAYVRNGVFHKVVKRRTAKGFIDNDSPTAYSVMQVMVPDTAANIVAVGGSEPQSVFDTGDRARSNRPTNYWAAEKDFMPVSCASNIPNKEFLASCRVVGVGFDAKHRRCALSHAIRRHAAAQGTHDATLAPEDFDWQLFEDEHLPFLRSLNLEADCSAHPCVTSEQLELATVRRLCTPEQARAIAPDANGPEEPVASDSE